MKEGKWFDEFCLKFEKRKFSILILLLFVFLVFFIPLILTKLDWFLDYNQETGWIGDTIGGIGGVIVGIIGVILTFFAFYMQYQANKIQIENFKEQMEKQLEEKQEKEIEGRFFELLKIHRENRKEINDQVNLSFTIFIEQFDLIYSLLREEILEFTKKDKKIEQKKEIEQKIINIAYLIFFFGENNYSENNFLQEEFIELNIKSSHFYETFFNKMKGYKRVDRNGNLKYLGMYFRHLYQTVTYIDEVKILSYKEKYHYVKTLRAQLSNEEEIILFFNSISELGSVWELDQTDDNKKLITKYNLIKHQPSHGIIHFINYYPDVHYEGAKKTENRIKLELEYT
ncbi:MAG: hypothetical protein A2X12_06330 [Bacteroidetes bacterium GWE2_29_8]|nr:MAG: hypothetical protein A2X12_06330 [Bacteroidetes bacterium GWE2_29_8]OFY21221.1 MAG: hypothetical protein A2X02_10410 [Bacteroidetes bacterium GWF2_29_10]